MPRVLLFSPDADTLFFTTPLDTTIHAYSIPTGESLPSLDSCTCSPTVVAISGNGDILLSASASPPTIWIQDRRVRGLRAVEFKCTDSTTTVTCAAFGAVGEAKVEAVPFVLGFKDGTVVKYEAVLPALAHLGQSPSRSRWSSVHLQATKISAIKKVHKAAMGGVAAIAFVPGYRSRVISAGHDGRCRFVNLGNGGQLLRT